MPNNAAIMLQPQLTSANSATALCSLFTPHSSHTLQSWCPGDSCHASNSQFDHKNQRIHQLLVAPLQLVQHAAMRCMLLPRSASRARQPTTCGQTIPYYSSCQYSCSTAARWPLVYIHTALSCYYWIMLVDLPKHMACCATVTSCLQYGTPTVRHSACMLLSTNVHRISTSVCVRPIRRAAVLLIVFSSGVFRCRRCVCCKAHK